MQETWEELMAEPINHNSDKNEDYLENTVNMHNRLWGAKQLVRQISDETYEYEKEIKRLNSSFSDLKKKFDQSIEEKEIEIFALKKKLQAFLNGSHKEIFEIYENQIYSLQKTSEKYLNLIENISKTQEFSDEFKDLIEKLCVDLHERDFDYAAIDEMHRKLIIGNRCIQELNDKCIFFEARHVKNLEAIKEYHTLLSELNSHNVRLEDQNTKLSDMNIRQKRELESVNEKISLVIENQQKGYKNIKVSPIEYLKRLQLKLIHNKDFAS